MAAAVAERRSTSYSNPRFIVNSQFSSEGWIFICPLVVLSYVAKPFLHVAVIWLLGLCLYTAQLVMLGCTRDPMTKTHQNTHAVCSSCLLLWYSQVPYTAGWHWGHTHSLFPKLSQTAYLFLAYNISVYTVVNYPRSISGIFLTN